MPSITFKQYPNYSGECYIITDVKCAKGRGRRRGESCLSLISGRDISSQEDLIKKKEGDWSVISGTNTVQLCVIKQHILGPCFNSWYTLVTYVGCSSLASHVHSVFTHHPPPQPTSFSLETSLCFWFRRHGHDERVLTPYTQLASHSLAFPCPPPHTAQVASLH